MMWRRGIIWVLVLTFLVAMAVPYLAHWREPRYQGKRISQWLDRLNSTNMEEGETVRTEEGEALRKIGPAGLPWILRRLQSRDSRLKLKLEELAYKQSVVQFRFNYAEDARRKAVLAFRILGPEARGAVPELSEMLNDPELSSDAGEALAGIGREGVPALIGGLTNLDWRVRAAVLPPLSALGTNAEPALPVIIAALEDTIPEVRLGAFRTLGSAGQNQPELVLPVLIEKFHSGDAAMRRYSLAALARFGTNHMAEVMPVLLEGLADQDGFVQSACIGFVAHYKSQAMAAVPKLSEIMVSDPQKCSSAASALREILGADGMAHIMKGFAEEPSPNHTQFGLVMKSFQREVRDATVVPEVLALIGDKDERVRVLAIFSLGIICKSPETVVPRLTECLALPDQRTRCAAAEALGCFGETAKSAIPALLEIIKQERESGQAHPKGIGYLATELETEEATFKRRYGLRIPEDDTDSKSGAPNAASSGASFEWALKRIETESAKQPWLRFDRSPE
ncbi:MAG: repeat protein [Pedosphaera sp.]|nr:repeat protein [Pedosphaera sp.]